MPSLIVSSLTLRAVVSVVNNGLGFILFFFSFLFFYFKFLFLFLYFGHRQRRQDVMSQITAMAT